MIPIPVELTLQEGLTIIRPLSIFVAGMVIYSIFIFMFYRFIARREIFDLDLDQYNRVEHPFLDKSLMVIFYIIEYLMLFPIFTIFWFGILVVLLSFLAKEQTIDNILLVSVALIGTVRVTAYYNEDLSKDLAKMLPFALLGIFLVDISFFSFQGSMTLISQIPSFYKSIIYYFLFVVCLEFILRIGNSVISPLRAPEKE